MNLRTVFLVLLGACALLLTACANDTSVKTPVPPAPPNHLSLH